MNRKLIQVLVQEQVTRNNMPPKEKKKSGANIIKYMPLIIIVIAVAYLLLAYFLLFMPKIGLFMAGGSLDIRPLQARLVRSSLERKRMQRCVSSVSWGDPIIHGTPDGCFIAVKALGSMPISCHMDAEGQTKSQLGCDCMAKERSGYWNGVCGRVSSSPST